MVNVLYFASLRELIGTANAQVAITQETAASEVWRQANPNIELPDSSLIAINQSYASLESLVSPGDEVAFFPPVTGG